MKFILLSDFFQGLGQVGDDVVGVFDADGEADQVGGDPGCEELLVAQLAVGVARRMEDAGTGVGDMGGDGDEGERIHEAGRILPASLETERQHAADPVREVFLRERMVLVPQSLFGKWH